MHRRHILALPLLLSATPALAHDEGKRGANGGVIGDVGNTHVEVLARDGEIRVWVLGANDRPVSAAGASGSVVVQAGGRQQTVRLEQGEGGAYLVGRGDFAAARGMRVVANLTLPGQPQRSARFTPMD
ncbi:hypothetical protein [Muricoccus radiodurans]|uniref:hypothetical protein n=1 Tax=Muricoccus radiodurans TaxID=2231721 RepID=UPI003CF69616